jgi:hypothetical protein
MNTNKNSSTDIADWRPEDEQFWESTGKRIAYRNLWISVPSLLCGFAIWGMWGIITVQMLNLGFPFSQAELFTLTAISGLAGATMRIPASFLIRLAGGRNTIFLTTAMLLAPAIGTGIVLCLTELFPDHRIDVGELTFGRNAVAPDTDTLLAAIATAWALDISPDLIGAGIKTFEPERAATDATC